MQRRATITDVAAHAGVSRTTVSLVLADADRIPDETKARVRSSMDEIGYVYNRAARVARMGTSSLLGLLLTDIRNPFFAELTMAVDRAAAGHGLSVVQGYSFGDAEREAATARTLAEHVLGGLVLLPTPTSDAAGLMAAARSQPLVQLLRAVPGLDSDYVGVDNVTSGRLLGEHLAGRRPGRVVLVGDLASTQYRDRRLGLASGLGLEVEESLGGADGFRTLLNGIGAGAGAALGGGVPDAVVTYNDTHLLAVLHALRDKGLRAGEDVAVASFDNTHIAADAAPGITSVDHHAAQLAEAAVRLLVDRMADASRPLVRVLVAPSLVVRESTLRA